MSYPIIKFSYNWNNKLECKSFSTVRISNENKYRLLAIYQIVMTNKKGEIIKDFGLARLQSITSFLLDNVSPAMAFLDSNLSKIDFIGLVSTMYKNKNINFKTKPLYFLVLQYLTPTEIEKL